MNIAKLNEHPDPTAAESYRLMAAPRPGGVMTTCQVTVWNPREFGQRRRPTIRPCGQPVVTGRLCATHEAERVRLGGVA